MLLRAVNFIISHKTLNPSLVRGFSTFTLFRLDVNNGFKNFKNNTSHSKIWGWNLGDIKPRLYHNNRQPKQNLSAVYYASAIVVLTLGLSYAAVPLYRIFCQVSNVR